MVKVIIILVFVFINVSVPRCCNRCILKIYIILSLKYKMSNIFKFFLQLFERGFCVGIKNS